MIIKCICPPTRREHSGQAGYAWTRPDSGGDGFTPNQPLPSPGKPSGQPHSGGTINRSLKRQEKTLCSCVSIIFISFHHINLFLITTVTHAH